MPKLTVGWREWIALPELGIPAIKAKVDTGAKTSALHTVALETYETNGVLMVHFTIHPLRKRPDIALTCTAEVVDQRIVSDSGGHRENRYFIRTPLSLGEHSWPIEMSLTNRDNMLFKMLLGRTAMANQLIVDPDSSYLTGRKLAKAYPKKAHSTIK